MTKGGVHYVHYRNRAEAEPKQVSLMAEREDVFITRNGKVVAKLTNPYQDRVDMAKSLFGIIPGDMTIEQAHRERLETV